MPLKLNSNQQKEPKIRNRGVIRASYVPAIASIPVGYINGAALKFMKKTSTITPKDSVELSKAVQEGLKQTGLYEKGVRVYKIKENPTILELIKKSKKMISDMISGKNNFECMEEFIQTSKDVLKYDRKDYKALNAIAEQLRSNKRFARLENTTKGITDILAKYQALMFKEGINACYLPKANKIITPNKSLQTSVFHEMGHALNNNGGILLKSMQKCRPLAKIMPSVILLISLLNKRKTTDKPQENDTKIQKGADFIKKNAGTLTMLSFMPMVAEEGIASLRGQKVAKKLVNNGNLSKELFKKIKLTNLGGFTTYALTAIATGIGAYLAVKAKDSIQAKYEQKKIEKFQKQQKTILTDKAK